MSRYTYAGEFKNPAKSYFVKEQPETGRFFVYVEEFAPCQCACANCTAQIRSERLHNGRGFKQGFDEADEAQDAIDAMEEAFEEDYDQYLDENRYEIAQMERYEAFRNEY